MNVQSKPFNSNIPLFYLSISYYYDIVNKNQSKKKVRKLHPRDTIFVILKL